MPIRVTQEIGNTVAIIATGKWTWEELVASGPTLEDYLNKAKRRQEIVIELPRNYWPEPGFPPREMFTTYPLETHRFAGDELLVNGPPWMGWLTPLLNLAMKVSKKGKAIKHVWMETGE